MHYIKHLVGFLAVLLFLFACGDSKYKQLIIGNWAGSEWLINGKSAGAGAESTGFSFTDKGEYTFENDGNIQKGTYKVEKDKLYTTPLNQQEIMVRIAKLTQDSLVFDMNRGGQSETLTLLRK